MFCKKLYVWQWHVACVIKYLCAVRTFLEGLSTHCLALQKARLGQHFFYFTALTYSLVHAHDSVEIVYFVATLFQKTYHKHYKLACTLEDTLLELCRQRATSH